MTRNIVLEKQPISKDIYDSSMPRTSRPAFAFSSAQLQDAIQVNVGEVWQIKSVTMTSENGVYLSLLDHQSVMKFLSIAKDKTATWDEPSTECVLKYLTECLPSELKIIAFENKFVVSGRQVQVAERLEFSADAFLLIGRCIKMLKSRDVTSAILDN